MRWLREPSPPSPPPLFPWWLRSSFAVRYWRVTPARFFSSSLPSHWQNMFPADGGKWQTNCMTFLSLYCWKSIDVIVLRLFEEVKDLLLSAESPPCSPAVGGRIYHCRARDRNLDFYLIRGNSAANRASLLRFLRRNAFLSSSSPA